MNPASAAPAVVHTTRVVWLRLLAASSEGAATTVGRKAVRAGSKNTLAAACPMASA